MCGVSTIADAVGGHVGSFEHGADSDRVAEPAAIGISVGRPNP